MVRMTAPNGAVVEVDDDKAERLLKQGFSLVKVATKKVAAKKSSK